MSTVIVAACGASSRFPGLPPKWRLTHPNGSLMIDESVRGLKLSEGDSVVYVLLREHLEGINQKFFIDRNVIVLDEPTRNQPETVAAAIREGKISGSIYVKDVDNYFETYVPTGNLVSTFSAARAKHDVFAKSYVKTENGIVKNIVEKSVISDEFCCGGYGFEDASQFLAYYWANRNRDNLYISHVIYDMILDGEIFGVNPVNSYEDWGTLVAWNAYKNEFRTIFIDLDGCLVKNSSEWFAPLWGESEGISYNVSEINFLYDSGKAHIIITTSRKSTYEEETLKQLNQCGLKYHRVIFDLPHCKRLLINDFTASNQYPTSFAINLPRNANNLGDYLKLC